jgi:hypothetical protein
MARLPPSGANFFLPSLKSEVNMQPTIQNQSPSLSLDNTVPEHQHTAHLPSDQPGQPVMRTKLSGYDIPLRVGQTVVVIRNISARAESRDIRTLSGPLEQTTIQLVSLQDTMIDMGDDEAVTVLHFVGWQSVPDSPAHFQASVMTLTSRWPLQMHTSPRQLTSAETSESDSWVDSETDENFCKLSEHLSGWGMKCPKKKRDIVPADALLFISQLDPTTEDYKYAATCVPILKNLYELDLFSCFGRQCDKDQRNALTLAVLATQKNTEMGEKHYQWNLNLITQLIKLGVPVNAQDKVGKTALIYAIKFDSIEVIKLLCNHDADIGISDNKRHNAWWHAAAHAESTEIFDVLKRFSESSATINQPDAQGKTPLMCAIERAARDHPENTDAIQILLRYGSNPAIADQLGNNAWIYAANSKITGLFEMLGHFDNLGIAINAANKKGETALSVIEGLMKSGSYDRNELSELSFIRESLLRFGATPTNPSLLRKYRKLRQLETLLVSEFASIKTRVSQLHASKLANLEAACAKRILPGENLGLYGGPKGDKYFKFYTSNIVEPVLSEFFKSLRKILKTTKIDKELFAPVFFQILLDQLGLMRNHIHQVATVSNPDPENRFGQRMFHPTILIDPLDGYTGWRKHVRHEIKTYLLAAFEECKQKKNRVSMRDVLDQMESNSSYEFDELYTENRFIFSKPGSAVFEFSLEPEVMNEKNLTRRDLKQMNLERIKCCHYTHRLLSAESKTAVMHLLEAILSSDKRSLQQSLKTHLFDFMEHTYKASYLRRGLAFFTESVVAGVCLSHDLAFDIPDWKTQIDRSNLALDHQFLSDFDGTLRERFMKSASIKKLTTS